MSEMTSKLVDPLPIRNPSLPDDATHIFIPRHSLYQLLTVTSALVFPSKLDAERLERAIQVAASWWPVVAGRLVYRESEDESTSNFAIQLTQSGIPLDIIDAPSHQPLPSDKVVQQTLEPYITPLPLTYSIPDSDTPLITFRLTFVGETKSVLGVSACHGIMDGATANRFLHHLSSFYADLEHSIPENEIPTFGPSVKAPRTVDDNAQRGIVGIEGNDKGGSKEEPGMLTDWYDPCEITEMFQELGLSAMKSEMVNITLSKREIQALKAYLLQSGSGGADRNASWAIREGRDKLESDDWISDQDALTGWWVSLLARIGEEVDSLWYAINYRDLYPSHPLFPSTISTNALSEILFTNFALSNPMSPGSTAKDVRASIQKIENDPRGWARYCEEVGKALEDGREDGRGLHIVPKEGSAVVNSNLKYDWTPTFGLSGRVTYHTEHACRRFLRVFRANGKDEEGRWDGSVELASQLDREKLDEFARLVEEDKATWFA